MKVLDTESYGSDSTFYASTTGEAPVIPKQPTSEYVNDHGVHGELPLLWQLPDKKQTVARSKFTA